ncbi:hypothetical protein TNCV_3652021 [Trichonephila clavipes]|uniref:Uncharacterized protein n=1 Tax=Trichonephila clavipes TaxID=2585209 RepID=A0A8X6S824_TRICX|nr:hypothetical protein TNCV_3652021 [Trichonephila clavipes]
MRHLDVIHLSQPAKLGIPFCCQRLTWLGYRRNQIVTRRNDSKISKIVRNGDMIDNDFTPKVKTCIACEHPDPGFRMVGHHRHILATFRDTILCMY